MKQLILFFSFLCLSILSFSQLQILKSCDDMTDKCYYFASEKIVLIDRENKQGFNIGPLFEFENNKLGMDMVICKIANIGACHENDKLILMFSDGTKLTFVSWNGFNCEGEVWFYVKDGDINKMGSFAIVKAYIQNGRTYESMSMEVPQEQQNYFMKIISDMRQGIIVDLK